MPEIFTIHDKDSFILPHIDELRDSQREGATQDGLEENCTGKLNEAQAHEVEYKY